MAMEYDGNIRIGGTVTNLTAKAINELSDVDIDKTALKDGQTLKYDVEKKRWVNEDDSIVANLGDLDDVSLENLKNKQSLVYDTETNTWINEDISDPGTTILYEDYMKLPEDERNVGNYYIPDYPSLISVVVNDNKTSEKTVWSSQKTKSEIDNTAFIEDGRIEGKEVTFYANKNESVFCTSVSETDNYYTITIKGVDNDHSMVTTIYSNYPCEISFPFDGIYKIWSDYDEITNIIIEGKIKISDSLNAINSHLSELGNIDEASTIEGDTAFKKINSLNNSASFKAGDSLVLSEILGVGMIGSVANIAYYVLHLAKPITAQNISYSQLDAQMRNGINNALGSMVETHSVNKECGIITLKFTFNKDVGGISNAAIPLIITRLKIDFN